MPSLPRCCAWHWPLPRPMLIEALQIRELFMGIYDMRRSPGGELAIELPGGHAREFAIRVQRAIADSRGRKNETR